MKLPVQAPGSREKDSTQEGLRGAAGDVNAGHVAADINDEAWSNPPPSENLEVAVRFNLNKLTDIDTVRSKAWVSIGIMFIWTDCRLVGWKGELPTALWGPNCWFFNAMTDLVEDQQDFDLDDPEAGRMKRYVRFMGSVDFATFNLKDFPMDVNSIRLTFRTASHWATRDGKRGSMARGRSYRLVPVSAEGEGSLFRVLWGGVLQELTFLGVSMELAELPPSKSGQDATSLYVRFHVARNVSYYAWKVILPVHLLMVLTLCVFALKVEQFAERLSSVITLFLASFAMLYVVEQHLPKTSFLTAIDKVIVMTTVLLVAAGVVVVILLHIQTTNGKQAGSRCNTCFVIGLGALYFVGNILLLVPAYIRRRVNTRAIVGFGKSMCHEKSSVHVTSRHYQFVPLEKIPRS